MIQGYNKLTWTGPKKRGNGSVAALTCTVRIHRPPNPALISLLLIFLPSFIFSYTNKEFWKKGVERIGGTIWSHLNLDQFSPKVRNWIVCSFSCDMLNHSFLNLEIYFRLGFIKHFTFLGIGRNRLFLQTWNTPRTYWHFWQVSKAK